jgi:hypothetical protein
MCDSQVSEQAVDRCDVTRDLGMILLGIRTSRGEVAETPTQPNGGDCSTTFNRALPDFTRPARARSQLTQWMARNPLRSRSTQIAREHRNAAKSALSYWRLYCRRAPRSRLKQWRRKAIVKRPPPLSNGGQIPTMPIWSLPGSKRALMRSLRESPIARSWRRLFRP